MKILNIHGYKGNAENSACVVLKNLGHEVISPQIDYDAKNPYEILDDLRKIFLENKPDYIVGTSLGGFFSLLLSQEFKTEKYESHLKKNLPCNTPAVLINPCLCPFITLPELEYKGDIKIFMELFKKISDNFREIAVIIGGNDEVINYHSFTENLIKNCFVVPDGKHSGATLNLDYWLKRLIK